MKQILSFAWVLTAAAALAVAGGVKGQPSGSVLRAYERFKALEGDWVGQMDSGASVQVRYEITGDGSTVLEHFAMKGDTREHKMTTLYHLDGRRLLLAHYCAAGNQPRMASAKGLEGKRVEFEFLDVTNADASSDGHMHEAVYDFHGPDRFSTSWTFFEKGKEKFTETTLLRRVATE